MDAREARLGDSDAAVLAKILGHIDFGVLAGVLVGHGEGDIFGALEGDTHDGVQASRLAVGHVKLYR